MMSFRASTTPVHHQDDSGGVEDEVPSPPAAEAFKTMAMAHGRFIGLPEPEIHHEPAALPG